MSLTLLPKEDASRARALTSYIIGTFLYEEGDEMSERSFLVPMTRAQRSLSSTPAEEYADQPLIRSMSLL